MLSDVNIKAAMQRKEIFIDPLKEGSIQPASVDLHLASTYRRCQYTSVIDVLSVPHDYSYLCIAESFGGILIAPGEMILCSTIEVIGLDVHYGAKVEGRSSLGRIGLMTHITAGWIDPGFEGNVTLEIVNLAPWEIRLEIGMRIAQICYFRLDSRSERAYGRDGLGSYIGMYAAGPVPAKGDIT